MRSRLAILLIACLAVLNLAAARITAPMAQDSPPITADEYWERVRMAQQAVRALDASPKAEVRAELESLAQEWESVRAVELPDGVVVGIDPSYLVAVLRAEEPDLERLDNLLAALLKAHEEYPQKVFTVQDVEPLKNILARPQFQYDQQGRAVEVQTPEWLDKIFDAIDRFFENLNRGIARVSYYGGVPLRVALALFFVLAIFFVSRGLARNLVRETELASEQDETGEALTSKGAMQRAQSLSSQGDYRNAIRYLYLSSLLILDEKGMLRYDRSRTNREVLRSVSAKPGVAQPLGDVIEVFDRVWYGFENVDDESFKTYMRHVDELREQKEG